MARGEPLIRQWNLIKALQAHRFGISADELAERLGCSKRQVQRDLNVLQSVGFPLIYDVRDFGKRFWKLSPQFIEREELMLSMTEILSLFLSRQLLAPLAGTQFGDGLASALAKIKALLPKSALKYFDNVNNSLLVKSIARHDYSAHDKQISTINEAIAGSRVVKMRYRSASTGRIIESLFHPYGLVLFGLNLYCIGYLADRNDVRTLKVARIEAVEPTNDTFKRPDGFSIEAYLQGSFGVFSPGRPQTVVVRFTGWAATNVREHQWHPSQKILHGGKDRLVVQFELADTTEFRRWVLGFGRHATVLRPESLARELEQELLEAAELYARQGASVR